VKMIHRQLYSWCCTSSAIQSSWTCSDTREVCRCVGQLLLLAEKDIKEPSCLKCSCTGLGGIHIIFHIQRSCYTSSNTLTSFAMPFLTA
jgi:hypothetical protein